MIKLSASSIGCFEKCPKQYHYRYIEKPEIEQKEWTHLEFGKCIHRVLELFHEDLLFNVRAYDEYGSVMQKSFRSALDEFDVDLLLSELPLMKDILKKYLSKIKDDGLPEVVSNEMEFNIMLDDYMVRGYIDRIDKIGEGTYRVVDYKTNKNPKYLTNFQLLLYAIVIKEKFPDAKNIVGTYVLLKNDCNTLNWNFTESDIEKTKQRILKVGSSIETKIKLVKWEKKPTILCNWCDYKSICQDNWAD